MSNLTVLIKSPDSTMSDILHTGAEMLGCTLASAVLCVVCGFLTAKTAAGFKLFHTRERLQQDRRFWAAGNDVLFRPQSDQPHHQRYYAGADAGGHGASDSDQIPHYGGLGHHQNRQ